MRQKGQIIGKVGGMNLASVLCRLQGNANRRDLTRLWGTDRLHT